MTGNDYQMTTEQVNGLCSLKEIYHRIIYEMSSNYIPQWKCNKISTNNDSGLRIVISSY